MKTDQLLSIDLTPAEASMLSLLARVGMDTMMRDVEQAAKDITSLHLIFALDPDEAQRTLSKKMKAFEVLIVDASLLEIKEILEEEATL